MNFKSVYVLSNQSPHPKLDFKWIASALVLLYIVVQTSVLLDPCMGKNEKYTRIHFLDACVLEAVLTKPNWPDNIKSFLPEKIQGFSIRWISSCDENFFMIKGVEKNSNNHFTDIISERSDNSTENIDRLKIEIFINRTGTIHSSDCLSSMISKNNRLQAKDDDINFKNLMDLSTRSLKTCYQPQSKFSYTEKEFHGKHQLLELSTDDWKSCMNNSHSLYYTMPARHEHNSLKITCIMAFRDSITNISEKLLLALLHLSESSVLCRTELRIQSNLNPISIGNIFVHTFVHKVVKFIHISLKRLECKLNAIYNQVLNATKLLTNSFNDSGSTIHKRWVGGIPNCKILSGYEQRTCWKKKKVSVILYSVIGCAGTFFLLLGTIQLLIYRKKISSTLTARSKDKSVNFLNKLHSAEFLCSRAIPQSNKKAAMIPVMVKNERKNSLPDNMMMSYDRVNDVLNLLRSNQQSNDKIKFVSQDNVNSPLLIAKIKVLELILTYRLLSLIA